MTISEGQRTEIFVQKYVILIQLMSEMSLRQKTTVSPLKGDFVEFEHNEGDPVLLY